MTDKKLPPNTSFFEPPHPSFDPLTASATELARHGIPPAPSNKRAHKHWVEAFSRKPHYVVPELKPIDHPKRVKPSVDTTREVWTSPSWSGSWAVGQNFIEVTGVMIAPTSRAPTSDGKKYWAYGWVGLGNTESIAQIGLAVSSVSNGGHENNRLWAWYEHFPFGPALSIPNFEVLEGDRVTAFSSTLDGKTAQMTLFNQRTNQYTGVQVTAPDPHNIDMSSAEWIVEAPGQPTEPLANFGTWFFPEGSSVVGAPSHPQGTVSMGEGNLVFMNAEDGSLCTQTLFEGEHQMSVTWLQAGP